MRGNVGICAARGTRHSQDGLSDNGKVDMSPFNALEHALIRITEPLQIRRHSLFLVAVEIGRHSLAWNTQLVQGPEAGYTPGPREVVREPATREANSDLRTDASSPANGGNVGARRCAVQTQRRPKKTVSVGTPRSSLIERVPGKAGTNAVLFLPSLVRHLPPPTPLSPLANSRVTPREPSWAKRLQTWVA